MAFLQPKVDAPATGNPESQPYQLDGPIPVPFGLCSRIAGGLLDREWNRIKNKEGKTNPQSYWFSLAEAFGHGGPRVKKVHFRNKGERVAGWIPLSGATTRFDIQYGDYGINGRIHRGDWDQEPDLRLNGVNGSPIPSADGDSVQAPMKACVNRHPGYAGMLYVVFDTFCPGWGPGADDSAWNGGSAISDVSLDVFAVTEAFVVGDESERYGVNPVALAYDIMSNDVWGADYGDRLAPVETWQALARKFRDEWGVSSYVSCCIADRKEALEVLSEIFGLYNAFIRPDATGRIVIDWEPPYGTITEPTGLLEITDADIIGDVEDDEGNGDWDDTYNSLTASFTNIDEDLGTATVSARSSCNIDQTEERRAKNFDWPGIHDITVANQTLRRMLRLMESPQSIHAASVKVSALVYPDGRPARVGDLIHWDSAKRELDMVCRIISLQAEDVTRGAWRVTWKREAGQSPQDYVPTADERELPSYEPPGNITDLRLWEVPQGLRGRRWPSMVMPLIERPSTSVISVRQWISATGSFSGEEAQLPDLTAFAIHGALLSAIDETTNVIRFSTGNGDLDGPLSYSYGDADVQAGTMLALIGDELIVLGALIESDEGQRTYAVERGRFLTSAASHGVGTGIWVFRRANLAEATEHDVLQVGTRWMRFQPVSLREPGGMTTEAVAIADPGQARQYSEDAENWHDAYNEGVDIFYRDWIGLQDGYWSPAFRITPEPGVMIWFNPPPTLKRSTDGSYTPASVMLSAAIRRGANAAEVYAGRWKVETATATDTYYQTDYVSTQDESSFIWTPPAGITRYQVTLFESGATDIVAYGPAEAVVVFDGQDGQGTPGADGNRSVIIYRRYATKPPRPTGDNPLYWSQDPSTLYGSQPMWMSTGILDKDDELVGGWSSPIRVPGNVTYIQDKDTINTSALQPGDLCIDRTKGQLFRWGGSSWEAVQWTANAIAVPTLSALAVNAGVLTAGVLQSPDGYYVTNLSNGQTITRSTAGYMTVIGRPFGSNNQFQMWYGPYKSNLNDCTEGNALFYLTTDGGVYVQSIGIGDLSVSANTTSTSTAASVTLGPYGTRGLTKTIKLNYGFTQAGAESGMSSGINNSTAISARLNLYRRIGSGSEVQVATFVAGGSASWMYESEMNQTLWTRHIDGNFTYIDTDPSTADRTYRAALAYRGSAGPGGGLYQNAQSMTLSSSEVTT